MSNPHDENASKAHDEEDKVVVEPEQHQVPISDSNSNPIRKIQSPLRTNSRDIVHRSKKRSDEINSDRWKKRSKHMFILNWAGKPIYSRYGEETKLASIIGVISGLISFLHDRGDKIRSIIAGEHRIVFKLIDPIWIVCVSKTGESISMIERQMDYMHGQIIFSLSKPMAHGILERRPQFDIRTILTQFERDFDVTFDRLIKFITYNPSPTFNCVQPFRIPYKRRHEIGNVLLSQRKREILFIILLASNRLVQLLKPKNYTLYPLDVHLIINYVSKYKHEKFKESRVCLPLFDASGFLSMYIYNIALDTNIVFLTNEQDAITSIQKCYEDIQQAFQSTLVIRSIESLLPYQRYTTADVGEAGLVHFIFKAPKINQLVIPDVLPEYMNKKERLRLARIYSNAFERMRSLKYNQPKVYVQHGERQTLLIWITADFHLYAIFVPLRTIEQYVKSCNAIVQWVRKNEESLFLIDSPVW